MSSDAVVVLRQLRLRLLRANLALRASCADAACTEHNERIDR